MRAKEGRRRVERKRRGREILDRNMVELQERRNVLLEEDETGALEMSEINERQEGVKIQQGTASMQRIQLKGSWMDPLMAEILTNGTWMPGHFFDGYIRENDNAVKCNVSWT